MRILIKELEQRVLDKKIVLYKAKADYIENGKVEGVGYNNPLPYINAYLDYEEAKFFTNLDDLRRETEASKF